MKYQVNSRSAIYIPFITARLGLEVTIEAAAEDYFERASINRTTCFYSQSNVESGIFAQSNYAVADGCLITFAHLSFCFCLLN